MVIGVGMLLWKLTANFDNLMSYLFVCTLKAKPYNISFVLWMQNLLNNINLFNFFMSKSVSHTVDVLFYFIVPQNHNVGHGGVSHHLSPPAQRQIREISHQHRESFVLFIKNCRAFSKLSWSLCLGAASIFSVSLQRISCNDLICL